MGQESQESSCLRKGTPLASRGAQRVSGPLLSCVWNLRVFPEMHDGDSAPSCCAFTHWVAFEEVSRPRVLFKSGQGNRGLSACGNTHGASLKIPSEAGYILRCAGKLGDPSRQRRGIDSPVAIRRGEGAQMKWCQEPRCSPLVRPVCRGTFGVALRVPNIISHLKTERGTTLETLERARASSCNEGETTWFFSS